MHNSEKSKDPSQANQSSEKLLNLIEAMSLLTEPGRLQDIAKQTNMSPSTTLRFLNALQHKGYAMQDVDTGRYFMTQKVCILAESIKSRTSVRNIAMPFLRSIAHVFSESANLVVENQLTALYIDVVNANNKTLMTMQRIGHAAPLHSTGAGKLILADFSPLQFEQYLSVKGLERLTEYTICVREELLQELEKVKERGYAFDNEECETGARCVAVPIRDFSGKIVACISVSGPSTRMTDRHIFEHLPYLMETAKQISGYLGWTETANGAEATL